MQRIEVGAQGWWRILVLKSRGLGWVPATALMERLETSQRPQRKLPYYYIAVLKLNLRAQPSDRGELIRTLRFNEQVQKLGESKGWFRVRQPASGAVGWVRSNDLESLPMRSPRGGPAKEELKPFKQREEPLLEPEFM